MKCENHRFEKEGETRAGEGMEMEEREKELGKIEPESARWVREDGWAI